MPSFDELVFGLNRTMNDKAVRRKCRDQGVFGEGKPLTNIIGNLGLPQTDPRVASTQTLRDMLTTHLGAVPAGVGASLMHILRFICEEKNEDIPITLAWLGGYYRLEVQHSEKTEQTRGMVTVILHTPPPSRPRTS
jgi:hypothetical protein